MVDIYKEDFRLAICAVLENRATGQQTPHLYWTWSDQWLRKIKSLLDALANDGVEVYTDYEPITNSTIFKAVRRRTPVEATLFGPKLCYWLPIFYAQCAVDLGVFNYQDEQVFNILTILTKKLYCEETIPAEIRGAMHRGDLEW